MRIKGGSTNTSYIGPANRTTDSGISTLGAQSNSVVSTGNEATYEGAQGTSVTATRTEIPASTNTTFVAQQGGASSDWRNTNYSRGPVNYPRNGWYNGEKLFKQFAKNAPYIPNDKLAHSVAPISTGVIKQDSPVGESISGWANSYAKF